MNVSAWVSLYDIFLFPVHSVFHYMLMGLIATWSRWKKGLLLSNKTRPISSSSSHKSISIASLLITAIVTAPQSQSERTYRQIHSMWNAQYPLSSFLVQQSLCEAYTVLPLEVAVTVVSTSWWRYLIPSMLYQWREDIGIVGTDRLVFLGCKCLSAVQAVWDGTDRLETSKDNRLQRDCPSQYPGQWIFQDVYELRRLPSYRLDLV